MRKGKNISKQNTPLHPAIGKILEKYDLSTADKTYEALREILQEIVLLGLYRAGFFNHHELLLNIEPYAFHEELRCIG